MLVIRIFLLLVFYFATLPLWGQDLSTIKRSKPFSLSGYLSASSYGSDRSQGTSTFGWNLSGSATVSIFGVVNIPFTLVLSDRQLAYNQPSFTRVGLSPSYKWIRVHAGYRNMNLSPYSLNGYTFLGGGLELNPGKFRFAAMYGKLENEWYGPTDNIIPPEEQLDLYQRFAYGGKIGFGSDHSFFELNLFKAKDKSQTGNWQTLLENYIYPAENLVVGTSFGLRFFKKVSLRGNVAGSAVTENQNALNFSLAPNEQRLEDNLGFLFTANASSRYAFAGDLQLGVQIANSNIGLKYQRVDPFYRSFGAYFLLNDYENFTGNLSLSFGKGRINFNGSYGMQRNNLKNYRSATDWRQIVSASVSITAKKGFSLTASYANYSVDQKAGFIEVNDSFRLANVNHTFSFSPTVSWKKNQRQSTISLYAGASRFTELSGFFAGRENYSTNGNLNYRLRWKESGLAIKTGLLYSNFSQDTLGVARYGATLGCDKEWGKKFRANLNLSANLNRTNSSADGFTLRNSLTLSYSPFKRQTLSTLVSYFQRKTTVLNPISEWQGRLSYSLSF